MTWVGSAGFTRRPLVVAEDHLHHVTELLSVLAEAEPSILSRMTVLCLDRTGPDTTRLVDQWLETYPALQVAASLGLGSEGAKDARRAGLDAAVFESANRFCKTLAGMLRPGGLVLQDIQLSTLAFIPPDRWWESIYLASTVRGMFAENPPTCRFLSNKRGYEATFGRDLIDAGFNPRDVMDKGELREMVVPVVRSFLERAFPWTLQIAQGPPDAAVAKTEEDRREIESELDLVVWSADLAVEIGGRLLGQPASGVVHARRAARRPRPGRSWPRTASAAARAFPSWRSVRGSPRRVPAAPRSPTWRRGTSMACGAGSRTVRRS